MELYNREEEDRMEKFYYFSLWLLKTQVFSFGYVNSETIILDSNKN